MHIDLNLNSNWSDITKEATELLNLNPDSFRVQLYKGLYHAIFDVTQGLVKQFPHKKKVFYFKSVSPLIDKAMAYLAKSGYKVVSLKYEDMQNVGEWIEQVDREALFVIYPVDDPLIGMGLKTSALEAAFEDKRVFKVKVSHAVHFTEGYETEPLKYDLPIYSVNANLSAAIVSDKARGVDGLNSGMIWQMAEVLSELEKLKNTQSQREKIEQFENQLKEVSSLCFQKGDKRCCDRIAFYWQDMDGAAVINELAKELNIELGEPGQSPLLETASLSRWGGVRTMDWLQSLGWSLNQIRGTVFIAHECINDELLDIIKSVRLRLLKMQHGELLDEGKN